MKYKKLIVRGLCVFTIVSIFIGTIWNFSLQLQRALTRSTYQTLSNVSIDYNKAFLDRISYNIMALKVLTSGIAEMEGKTKEDVQHVLQRAVQDGDFSKIAVSNEDGLSYSNNGLSTNISQRDYFQKAMQGETIISEPLSSMINGDSCIVIAVPIHNDITITGVLIGVYPLATAEKQLLDFSYYSEGYGFVVAPNGRIILSSNHTDKLANEANLFTFFKKVKFVDFSMKELQNTIKNGESGSFSFTYHGERRFVSFTPSTLNDWYTFSLSSDKTMLHQEKITTQIVFQLILGLAIVGVLLLIWLMQRNRRHNNAILTANQKYQSLISHINGGMIVAIHSKIAKQTIVTYVSPGFTDMTGYTLEDIQTIYHGCYLDLVLDEDRETVFATYLEQLKQGNTYRMPYRIHKKDDSFLWVMDNGYLVEDEDGLHNHTILSDITIIKQQEEELRLSENRFSIAINASSGALFEVDLKKQLYTHFENAPRIFGINAEKLLEDTEKFSTLPHEEYSDAIIHYFFHPDDYSYVKKAMNKVQIDKSLSFEARVRQFNNSYIWSRIDLVLSTDEFGVPAYLIGFMSDIDRIKKQAELLENQVQTDPMTGLYNKVAMATLANKILEEDPTGHHALIVLDIDNFKGINDTLGHAFGDVVLIEACTKLKTMFRSNDIVGRMGGDEFAILMKNIPDTNNVLKKVTEVSKAFQQTYTGKQSNYTISCSMGIILINTSHESFEALYRKADAALYQAKQNGKDQFVLYQEKNATHYPIEYTRTNDEELQNLKISHDIATHIFELMYTSKDFDISINMALAAIGQQYHVSRVSIFENSADNLTTSNIYEWCNDGISPEIYNLQNLNIISGSESILDSFDKNGLLYCNDVRELPPYLRQILKSQGILSNLQVTITNDEKICGFIGFDECRKYRIWTSEEIEKLSFLAKVLSVFLFKKTTEMELLENLHTRLKILDILPDYICVINPETHVLEYTNNKMQELLPDAAPGAFCFTTLRGGQVGPCDTCLLERIKRGETDNLKIISKDKHTQLNVNALSINWTKSKKMVLLYGMENT
ncbi:MAG: diguanylate cyclase [Lachnospiraceae bacterium]